MFREGQMVKQGELLAQIDPRPYQVQLAQAEGTMARDQALLKNAQADLDRYRTLFEQDSIAKQQLDTQASLVRQYEGAIKADQAQIDSAKLQLTYSRITAPIGGRLGLRQVDPGNIVHASDTNGIVVITQLQPVTVVYTLPEDNISAVMKQLHAGQKLTVDAYDRAGRTKLASGMLLTVDNQIDPATGTIKLKAQFANDDSSLFPNQFVNARMLLDVMREIILIPSAAVQRGTQGTFVYVVRDDQSVTVRTVKLGPTEGETAAIESGLSAGEIVVVDGTDKLRDGAKVEVGERNAAAAPPDGGTPKHGKRRRDGDASPSASSS
jgi:multidrug efflux system membrane fusion protein